jgi:hypothetical protein
MSQASFPEHESQTATLEVQLGGRTFSPSRNTPPTAPRDRIRELQQRPEEAQLPKLLQETLAARLPWNSLRAEVTDRQSLVEAYVASLTQLGRFREDVDKLVRAGCQANLEFRQLAGETNVSGRDAALAAKLDAMLTEAACDWLPIKNVLDARVVSQSVALLRPQLQTAIDEAVADFATQFFELLAKLVERQFFGLVEWLPNHCCGYHFFKRVIIQENLGLSGAPSVTLDQQYYEPRSNRRDASDGPRIIGRRTVAETEHGKHFHRFARHEHSVMNAVCTTIANSKVVMPPQVVALLKQVPDWLYPFIQVIDGDIFRERIIEQDTGVETWTDVRVRDEPIYGCEPAVIIGPYVLTGWGPREVGQEQARRDSVHTAAQRTAEERAARRRAPWFAVAAVAMAVIGVLLLIQWLRVGRGGPFVVLATIAAIGSVWQSAFDFGTVRRNAMAAVAAHFTSAAVAFQILLVYWLAARWFQPMSWVTPVALGLAAVLCFALGRRFR